MKILNKFLAVVAMAVWLLLTIGACLTIVGGVLLFITSDDWRYSGERILDKILE